jgi:hypothetical protein
VSRLAVYSRNFRVCVRSTNGAHHYTHTYEKSDPTYDSLVALLRGVQAALFIMSRSLCFSPGSFPPFLLVGLNAAITYSRAEAHSRSRSEDCPFTHPTDFGHVVLGLTNHEKYARAGT